MLDTIDSREAAQVIAQSEELRLLRAFFDAWSDLHQIRQDARGEISKLIRMRLELQAQALVEAADAVQAHRAAGAH